MLLVPAYGRDYETAEEVMHDFWHEEKDFKIAGTSTVMSIRDIKAWEGVIAAIRFNGLSEITHIPFNKY